MENFITFIDHLKLKNKDDSGLLLKAFTSETYSKGTTLLEPGKRAHYLYFIEKGLIRTYFLNERGLSLTTSFFKEMEVVTAADSFFNHTPSIVGIECIEDVEILKITLEDFQSLIQNFPSINQIRFDFLLFFYNKTSHRLMSTVSLSASERYKNLLEEVPEILNRAPLGHIASYLGISQETLSRIRSKY